MVVVEGVPPTTFRSFCRRAFAGAQGSPGSASRARRSQRDRGEQSSPIPFWCCRETWDLCTAGDRYRYRCTLLVHSLRLLLQGGAPC